MRCIELRGDYIEKYSIGCTPFFFMVELQDFLNAPRSVRQRSTSVLVYNKQAYRV